MKRITTNVMFCFSNKSRIDRIYYNLKQNKINEWFLMYNKTLTRQNTRVYKFTNFSTGAWFLFLKLKDMSLMDTFRNKITIYKNVRIYKSLRFDYNIQWKSLHWLKILRTITIS